MGLDKRSEGLSKHVKWSLIFYMAANLIFGALFLYLLWRWQTLTPDDPFLIPRAAFEKITKFICGCSLLVGFLEYLEVRTNGNLMGQILQDPRSCAWFVGTGLLAMCLLFVAV